MDSLQRDPLLSSQIKNIYGLNSKKVELIEDKRILKNPVHFGMKSLYSSSIWNATDHQL